MVSHTRFTTLQTKSTVLDARKREIAEIDAEINAALQMAASDSEAAVGCGTGLCRWLARLRVRKTGASARTSQIVAALRSAQSTGVGVGVGASVSAAASSAAVGASGGSRLFGLAGKRSAADPGAKLDAAAMAMRERIASLESRAVEARVDAKKLAKTNKPQALRALKRAKQLEAQALQHMASLDAVDQQIDMLASAAVQKTLTSALTASSKTLRGDQQLLARAEKAVDDATDARDMAADLQNVVAEFASSAGDVDDDELADELAQMLEDDHEPPNNSKEADDGQIPEAALAALGQRLGEWDARAAAATLPATPAEQKKAKREEKAGLLS